MPSLALYTTEAGSQQNRRTALNMAARMRLFDWQRLVVHDLDGLTIAEMSAKQNVCTVLKYPKIQRWFVIDGYLCDDGLSSLGELTQQHRNELATELNHRYERGGISALTGLDGCYNLIVWSAKQRLLEIATDLLATKRLHAWQGPHGLALATQLKAFLDCPGFSARPNKVVLAEMLSIGHSQSTETVLDGVSALEPHSAYRIEQGRIRKVASHTIEFHEEPVKESPAELADHALDLFNDAWRRRAACGPILISASGGMDSRMMLAAAARSHSQATALVWGWNRGQDFKLGVRAARSLGLAVQAVPVPAHYVRQLGRLTALIDEGRAGLFCGQMLWALRQTHVPGSATGVAYGHMGDVLAGSHIGQSIGANHSPIDIANQIIDFRSAPWFSPQAAERLLRPMGATGLSRRITERCAHLLSRSQAKLPCLAAHFWDTYARQIQSIGSYVSLIDVFARPVLPFVDRQYMRFWARLPVELLRARKLYHRVVQRATPLSLPFAGQLLARTHIGLAIEWRAKYCLKLLSKYLLPYGLVPAPKWSSHQTVRASLPFLRQVLLDSTLDSFLDRAMVSDLLAKVRRDRFSTAGQILTAANVAMVCSTFFGTPQTPQTTLDPPRSLQVANIAT